MRLTDRQRQVLALIAHAPRTGWTEFSTVKNVTLLALRDRGLIEARWPFGHTPMDTHDRLEVKLTPLGLEVYQARTRS